MCKDKAIYKVKTAQAKCVKSIYIYIYIYSKKIFIYLILSTKFRKNNNYADNDVADEMA